ncbi:NUDIX hydrolase [Dermatophilus congolensis]|uniref:NUDIX domain-containing protein n=1 Tax=Dermatophilus congolensis TaxID=1863 RepID=UPI001AAF015D|nr:NUDIX hydrolase [Dermatophilus congolensis]MBO3151375.1 NUDIX hydrolase [Dermatophilus congolensis]MBO3161621.1 NUDIX hydrolase [Dermatophilus congolensis]MBO3176214.1 NUDIX hydrolase [Dermatophilus congolensis]MBO3182973.1 NUDIX hydrolase [Dermatophilus congolensis]MBO3202177.1 NUDIX hydrolase [Dermatophilus congolensis]
MSLEAPLLSTDQLFDEYGQKDVHSLMTIADGAVFGFDRARVDLGPTGGLVTREYLTHPGAVAVLALRTTCAGNDQILLIKQYRHAVGIHEWELPAGLLDNDDEPPAEAAARELEEEADIRAATWHTLTQFAPSAGASTETIRIYLARDFTDVPSDQRYERCGEEADIRAAWVDLDTLYEAVIAGQLANAPLIIGVLTAYAARERDWKTLQPANVPFPLHPAHRDL